MAVRKATQSLVGVAVTVGGLLQVEQVRAFVAGLVAHSPRLSAAFGTVLAVAAILHNPQVCQLLHLPSGSEDSAAPAAQEK